MRARAWSRGRAGRGRGRMAGAGSGPPAGQGVWPAGPAAFPIRRRLCVALHVAGASGKRPEPFLEGLGGTTATARAAEQEQQRIQSSKRGRGDRGPRLFGLPPILSATDRFYYFEHEQSWKSA